MSKYGELPKDYALDALALEADKRAKNMGDPSYSYGKLVADTSEAERMEILTGYRKRFYKKHGGGKVQFDVTEQEIVDKLLKKQQEGEEAQ